MTMRFFRYLHYLVRAKGRHGTHSPFVYNFVESVLRNADNDKIKVLIEFLNPDKVRMMDAEGRGAEDLLYEKKDVCSLREDSLLIISMAKAPDWNKLLQISFPARGSLLILHPHAHQHATRVWKELLKRPDIKMSIDCWSWGLLINDKAFKEKQHFYLR